ncbi:MAG: RluA family pseudouridine synthase [Planctomycetota bacterium]
MRELVLGDAEAGQRLDRLLRKLLADVPLGTIFRLLRRGVIRVDGKRAKPDLRTEAGMRVTMPDQIAAAGSSGQSGPTAASGASDQVDAAASRRPPSVPHALQPRIVHRDDELLVVDKPAGLAVQPGTGHDYDLCSWLDQQSFGVRSATYRPAPVHRLDRGTSGLVACGLSPAASRALSESFRSGAVGKVYVAVVEGRLEAASGTIDAPLLLRSNARAHQPKVSIDPRGRPARSDYERLEVGLRHTLVRLTLHTGRTHQLRAHLAHLGYPIVGDRRYGAVRVPKASPRSFLLHAAELELPHPGATGERQAFVAPVPAEFPAELRLR